jgi:hypothetical protein
LLSVLGFESVLFVARVKAPPQLANAMQAIFYAKARRNCGERFDRQTFGAASVGGVQTEP